jgi:hypothetical protein
MTCMEGVGAAWSAASDLGFESIERLCSLKPTRPNAERFPEADKSRLSAA